jgi:glycosyltransferase involved in cell wall biosynthesis
MRTGATIGEGAQRAAAARRKRTGASPRRWAAGTRRYVAAMAATATRRPQVVILRGHQANPWELRQWAEPALAERFDVSYLRSGRGWFDTSEVQLPSRRVRTLRDLLPPGRLGDAAVRLPGDRYLGLRRALEGADIVHAQELGYWYSMQAAQLKARLGFRLVLTVWETIPALDAYRNVRTRAYRRGTLAATDLFLAATERAASALRLEGAPPERVRVCAPGVPPAGAAVGDTAGGDGENPGEALPLILSPGRLVWEKGHQDVLRALALLRRGSATQPPLRARLLIVGRGPEQARLRSYADELGLAGDVELLGFVAHAEMASLYAQASCLVLASLPIWSWEEQFGMVLAEAMAAGTPIVASSSGAIPEVAGERAAYFAPGDWIGLAARLREAVAAPPRHVAGLPELYSTSAAAARLAAAYEDVLA